MMLQVCRTHTPSPMCEARAANLRRLVAGGRAVASRLRRFLSLRLRLVVAAAAAMSTSACQALEQLELSRSRTSPVLQYQSRDRSLQQLMSSTIVSAKVLGSPEREHVH